MPVRSPLALLAALALLLGCAENEAAPGEPGGPCRVGVEPCVAGYGCGVGGVCTALEPDMGVTGYAAVVDFPEERVPGDGQTPVEFLFTIETITPDGERRPYDTGDPDDPDDPGDGALFLTPIPPEAGRVLPARPVLIDGLGVAEFVPCARGDDPQCPEAALIRVGRDEAPLESIGDSARFLIVQPAPVEPDMGPEPDGGM